MKKEELVSRIVSGCNEVLKAETELTEIDARFGDADHGITMTKIANAIREAAMKDNPTIKAVLDEAATAVMMLNGGSAVPLWNTWLDGLCEGAPEADEANLRDLKNMFASGFSSIDEISGAKVGDKTMMDALIPASEAIASCEGDENALFEEAAQAAIQGADATKNFIAKYGRAKSYGEKTIGCPDAGAVSMSYFFKGLAEINH